MTKEDDQACGKCRHAVPEKAAICCDGLCNKWFDLKCANLTLEEYNMINKLGDKVKWYCNNGCSKNVGDITKIKMSKSDEDWSSILNVVLAGVQGNSEATVDLANRVQELEKRENETKNTLKSLVKEMGYIRGSLETNKIKSNDNRGRPIKTRLAQEPNPSPTAQTLMTNKHEHEKDDHVDMEQKSEANVDQSDNRPDSPKIDDTLSVVKEIENYDEDFPSISSRSGWKVANYSRRKRSNMDLNYRNKEERTDNKRYTGEGYDRPREGTNRPNIQHKPRNNTAVIGKMKTTNGLVAVEKSSWLFISRLEASVKKEAVEEFVSNLCDGKGILCEELQTRYNTYKSFKVGCPVAYQEKLLNGEVWPEGILVTKYVPQKKYNSNKEGFNSRASYGRPNEKN